jgi:hypothetical protein
MINKSHIRSRQILSFDPNSQIRLHFSSLLRSRMRSLWLRKRQYGETTGIALGSLYATAFSIFTQKNLAPKTIPRISRTSAKLQLPESALRDLQAMKKIAVTRNQPLSIIIEEALQTFLDIPDNYLGKDLEIASPIEKIS